MIDKLFAAASIVFVIVAAIVFLAEMRFHLPIRWRIRSPRWDRFLCSTGSHRCRSSCGCCWTCMRCDAEKNGAEVLAKHYEDARAFIGLKAQARVGPFRC